MKIDILTLFPEMFTNVFKESIVNRAQLKGVVEINIHNLRKWTKDNHKTVDDRPYGGGAGMIMMVEPIDLALQELKTQSLKLKTKTINSKVILTSAKGKTYTQSKADEYSKLKHIIIVCGHYEGVDQRVADHLVDEEISVGNYVLSGGEIPAMVITDSVVRLIPGSLGNPESLLEESYSLPTTNNQQLITNLEYPQYTRPENYKGWKVPEILLSGNHKEIEKWRKRNSG